MKNEKPTYQELENQVLKLQNQIKTLQLKSSNELKKEVKHSKELDEVVENDVQLQKRVNELEAIYLLYQLKEDFSKLEAICKDFVNKIIPKSMRFPEKIYVLFEINQQQYANNETYTLTADKECLTCNIVVFGKSVGKLTVAYTENLSFLKPSEQKIIDTFAERISRAIEKIEEEKQLKEQNKSLIAANKQAIENELQTIIVGDTIPDLVWLKDTEGVYIRCNARFEQFFGATKSEIIGKTDYDFVDKELADFFRHNDKIAMEAGKPTTNEEELTFASDGHTEFLETIKTPLYNQNNEIIGILGVGRDMTKTKEYERNLITAKEKAEESDRLKSAFLANMSHEIRTPMNSILGFTQILKRGGVSEKEREEFLDIINSSGNQLLAIISDIIDISKVDANQISIHKTSFNINSILDDLHAKFSITIVNPNVTLSIRKGLNKLESNIKTDKNRLIQILSNLLENAIKFTEKGTIEFGYTVKDKKLKFFVKDTGYGIEKKNHQLIFKRFRQAEQKHTVVAGTGLGLSIVKELLKLLDGEIWVVSEIGKGATFYFTIPLVFQKKPKITAASKALFDDVKITVLIVEDILPNFLYLKTLFSRYNYQIFHATNGEEALKLFNKNKTIDIILMDIKMPIMDGFEATREIRKIDKKIPIIALTAFAMENDREKAIEAGCNDYISKPVTNEKLIEIMHKNIKQK